MLTECSKIHYAAKGKCEKSFSVVDNAVVRVDIRLFPVTPVRMDFAFNNTDVLLNSLQIPWFDNRTADQCTFDYIFLYRHYTGLFSDSNITAHNSYTGLLSHMEFGLVLNMSRLGNQVYDIAQSFLPSLQNKFISIFDDSETKFQIKIVQHDETKIFHNVIAYGGFSPSCGNNFESFQSAFERNYFDFNNMIGFPRFIACLDVSYCSTSSLVSPLLRSSVSVLDLLPCPKYRIRRNEYPYAIIPNIDGSLTFDGGYVLSTDHFQATDEYSEILVCQDTYNEFIGLLMNVYAVTLATHHGPGDYVEAMVSSICSGLSAFALTLTFCTFCALPDLRHTLPGKNNTSLVFVLLTAQVVYIVSSIGRLDTDFTSCKVIGFLVHFSWLLSLFWMNICTFHVSTVMSKNTIVSRSRGSRQYLYYQLYALILSLILIAINVVYTNLTHGGYGYGRLACYIAYPTMVLLTFALPAGLVIFSNLCMFTYVIIKLSRAPSVQKNVQNERNDLIVLTKLSTITGSTWIFGILNIWLQTRVLDYLFAILNGSQGCFIFLAFVCNKRVSQMLKVTFLKGPKKSTAPVRPTTGSPADGQDVVYSIPNNKRVYN